MSLAKGRRAQTTTAVSPPSRTPARKGTDAAWLIMAALVGAAALLRLWHLESRSLWLDEGISAAIVTLPWSQIARLAWVREANMLLYYALLKVWSIGDLSDSWLRAFSVVAGCITIPALYALGRRIRGASVGWIAALLLAASPFHIHYSREARSYALVALFSVLATAALLRMTEDEGGRRRGYIALCLAGIYSHVYFGLLVAAHGLALIGKPAARRRWFGAARWILYGSLPLLYMQARIGRVLIEWLARPSAADLSEWARNIAGGGWFVLVMAGAAMVFGIALEFKRWFATRDWLAQLLLWWAIMPALVLLFASLWKPLLLPRYVIFSLPAWILLAAVGFSVLKPQWLGWIGVAVLIVFAAPNKLDRAGIGELNDNWRAATSFVLDHADAGDGIMFYGPPTRASFEHYRTLMRPAQKYPQAVYPEHGPTLNYQDFVVQPFAEVASGIPQTSPRMWLVAEDREQSTVFVRGWLKQRYQLLEVDHFPGLDIELYQRR